jgi:acyl dehydratase
VSDVKPADLQVGTELTPRTVHVDRATLVRYAGASGDFNPIHWDERTAISVGLPNVIAHGMWTMGAAAQVVVDWIGDAGAITEYSTRFAGMVPVPHDEGADVVFAGKVLKLTDDGAVIDLTATCGETKVLTRARVTVRLS